MVRKVVSFLQRPVSGAVVKAERQLCGVRREGGTQPALQYLPVFMV